MNVELSEEQRIFDEAARAFLESRMPLTTVRGLYDDVDGFDRAWWQKAAELGWAALFVPEDLGGGSVSGSPAADAAIVAEQIGRALAPGPFLPVNVVAAGVARAGSAEQQAELLPALVSGQRIATWALAEPGHALDTADLRTTATLDDGDVVVSGEKAYVEAAGVADVFLVTAATGDGLTQVLVPRSTDGVTVTSGRSVDMTRRFGRVAFDDVRVPFGAVVGELGDATGAVERQLHVAIALQCAEMVGIADRTLLFTLEYGRERIAFGRPIVSFQALKHRIADMAVWLEGSKAVSDELARLVDAGDGQAAARLASVAKAYVGEHCVGIVEDCVQITGGIGVTWEHDIHLYNRRAILDSAIYGTPDEHKERLFTMLRDDT